MTSDEGCHFSRVMWHKEIKRAIFLICMWNCEKGSKSKFQIDSDVVIKQKNSRFSHVNLNGDNFSISNFNPHERQENKFMGSRKIVRNPTDGLWGSLKMNISWKILTAEVSELAKNSIIANYSTKKLYHVSEIKKEKKCFRVSSGGFEM